MGPSEDISSRSAVQVTTSTVTHNDNFELSVRPSVAQVPLAFVKEDMKEDYDDMKRDDADSVDRKHVDIGDEFSIDVTRYPRGDSDIDVEAGRDHHRVVSFQPANNPSPAARERRQV